MKPPILTPAEVRAIGEGRKTQFRVPVKPKPHQSVWTFMATEGGRFQGYERDSGLPIGKPIKPYYAVGELVWVKEPLVAVNDTKIDQREFMPIVAYASDRSHLWTKDKARVAWCWPTERIPARCMPRWASRYTLEVTGIRVERLQEISLNDIVAEYIDMPPLHIGIDFSGMPIESERAGDDPWTIFAEEWDKTHGPGSWDANPWVFAYTFRRAEG